MTENRFTPLIFEDHFKQPELNLNKWFPHYLPHWSNLEKSKASYKIENHALRLFISDKQAPWCPEYDGDIKVSGLQTGHYSKEVGSPEGQHRFRKGQEVRHYLPPFQLFLAQYFRLEMRARAKLNANNLAGLWLIGFEEEAEKSGEITLFEAFGHNIKQNNARIGRGVKQLTDPLLLDEVDDSELAINIEDWHTYAMEWTAEGIDFYLDDTLISSTKQSPNYPMQLMLNFYEFPSQSKGPNPDDAWFDIDFIRCFSMA